MAPGDVNGSGERSQYEVEHRSPKPRRRRRGFIIAGIVLGVLLFLVIAVAGGSYLAFYLKVHAANGRVDSEVHKVLDTPPPSTVVPDTASQTGTASTAEPAVNLVVLGSDARPDGKESTGSADVIMIMHIDRQNDYLSVLSVTRDLWVSIPGYGQDRINAAYTQGGAALTITTLKQTFGVDINEYLEVGFDSFAKIIDSLGGVYVDVDRRYDNSDDLPHGLSPGIQVVDGANALLYSRFRLDENADFGRMARQQRILASVRDQVAGADLATKMPGMVNTLLDYSATNLSASDLLSLGYWMIKLDGSRIRNVSIRAGGTMIDGKAVVVVDQATIVEAVTDLLTPPEAGPASGTAAGQGEVRGATGGALRVAGDDSAVRLALTTATTASTIPDSGTWKSAQADVPFALQAPAYVPEGYSFAYKMPEDKGTYGIKVGKASEPAVCMVYQYANTSECLRVTATTWLDAPLARSGSSEQSNGVTYTVVGTSGGADRVWWIENGVLYCVSNTLMHMASGQELLRIAESMVPVASLP